MARLEEFVICLSVWAHGGDKDDFNVQRERAAFRRKVRALLKERAEAAAGAYLNERQLGSDPFVAADIAAAVLGRKAK